MNSRTTALAGAVAFIVPFIIVLSNCGFYLGFADAAEFALVTEIAGIAHAPGFPSYVLTGFAWSGFMDLFGIGHVKGMIFFSVFCTAAATALLYSSCLLLLEHIYGKNNLHILIALCSSLAFVSGATAWHWSGNVEVYAFHILSFALMLHGLLLFHLKGRMRGIYIASAGIAAALANHHLTAILFLPFALFFFQENNTVAVKAKKKVLNAKTFFKWKELMVLAVLSFVLTSLFYGWMYVRSSAILPFEFGSPDAPSRFLYHLAGGAWIDKTTVAVKGIVGLRFPYFMKVTFQQLFLFIPLILAGWMELKKIRQKKFIYLSAGYYSLMLVYQLRIDQTADTDAYLLPAFFIFCLIVPFGAKKLMALHKNLVYALTVLLLIQVAVNFSKTDKRLFNVSETLMAEINRSVPENSILLIADWTTVIQYYYHRIAEGFRPDLYVLNYDIKFTNHEMLPVLYPSLYKEISVQYDHFIRLLGKHHPQEIYNTGCTLDNKELMDAYMAVILKLKETAAKNNVPFMCDPKAYVFLNQYGIMSNKEQLSGPFVSTLPTAAGPAFLKLDYSWLQTAILLTEPAASDKLVDLEAALDFNRNYYKGKGNMQLFEEAEQSYQRIKSLQRKMKRNIPFIYR